MHVTSASFAGGAGEDEHVRFHARGLLCLAVADGHGGGGASSLCRERLCSVLARDVPACHPPAEALRLAFRALHEECLRLPDCDGAALTVCAVDESTGAFVVANVGDAHCLLVTATSHAWFSTSHRLQDSPSERERVVTHITYHDGPPRLCPGGLSCGRSIGDADCPHVSCEPALAEGKLEGGMTLVVASDGVWDSVPARKVAARVREGGSAASLVRGATEDATAITLSRRPPRTSSFTRLTGLFRTASVSSFTSSDD
jgi:serine/threonine protein phosphatase PrpC